MPLTTASSLTAIVADPETALKHYENLLSLETDCWDVHDAIHSALYDGGVRDFVLLDVRSPESFAAAHIAGAANLPYRRINQRHLAAWPADALFVVYCNGPHCNAADRAAVALARLGRPVKKMIGGVEGWKDEGFNLETGPAEVL